MPNESTQPEINDPIMAIGVLTQKVGLSESAVRKYEREGLLIGATCDAPEPPIESPLGTFYRVGLLCQVGEYGVCPWGSRTVQFGSTFRALFAGHPMDDSDRWRHTSRALVW